FLLQILLYYRGFYSISADESGRTLLAYQYLNGIETQREPWLPFHKLINALALKIYPDLFWAPRITGTIFALLSATVFIYYSHRLFQNKSITLLASVIAVLFPPYVVIRAVPLAEVMYIFFIISALIFVLKWLQLEKKKNIIIASFLFGFSSSVRYEGWLFSLCLLVYLIFIYRKISPSLFFINFLILAGFPIYWILFHYIQTGDPFYFIASTSGGYRLHHKTFLMLLKYNLVTQFIYQNILYLNFGAAASIIFLSFTNEKIRVFTLFLFSAFILMAFLSFAGIGMPSHAFWRIPLVWSILLIPFSAHFLIKLSEYLAEQFKKEKKIYLRGFVTIMIMYFGFQIGRLTGNSMFTADERNTGRFINEKLMKEKPFKVLIDSSGWEYLNIYVASNFPDIFIPNTGPDSSNPEKPLIDHKEELKLSLLNKLGIKYLVFETERYKKFFDQYTNLKAVKSFGIWRIYSLLN
ncbi:MAG TPA: glycosyltransferase family 39 protein, partial [Ignavibacteriaceae bacterium]|nr:glycosyltransferase family 39 protein [Ignavibacteriaceae bacterium]